MGIMHRIGKGAAALGMATALIGTAATPADAWGGRPGFFGRPFTHRHQTCRAVPEIDPSAAGTAIALVSGGIAILKDRRRKGR